MSVTIETGSPSFQIIATTSTETNKHQRVKRTTLDDLDKAFLRPLSNEALAVECSTHFTHSKTILELRQTMTEATAKARSPTLNFEAPGPKSWFGLTTKDASIPQEKRAHTSGKYNFNVAKSMKSGTRKNEEEEAHKELKLGAIDVWALGSNQPMTVLITKKSTHPTHLLIYLYTFWYCGSNWWSIFWMEFFVPLSHLIYHLIYPSCVVLSIGIAVVIGGQYFGWNFSLAAGFGSCYIAMLMIGLAYLCLCLCNAGDNLSLPSTILFSFYFTFLSNIAFVYSYSSLFLLGWWLFVSIRIDKFDALCRGCLWPCPCVSGTMAR